MDEKTEELRDIFLDVSDEETVTESQEDPRGSLTDDRRAAERLERVVADMRERYEFSTDLDDGALRDLVRGFYEGGSDTDLAHELEVARGVVFRARMDLHLFRDADTDAPFDLDEFRERVLDGAAIADLADAFDVSESTVRRYRRVVHARDESRRANDRYRDEFDAILSDSDLADRMTEDVRQDGLEDATEGMETDVSF